MSAKSAINTPFQDRLETKVPSTKGVNGIYDHHTTPILSKPHSKGKDTIPLKFFAGNEKALEPNPEKFETPFNNTLYTAGAKKQGSTYQTPGKK